MQRIYATLLKTLLCDFHLFFPQKLEAEISTSKLYITLHSQWVEMNVMAKNLINKRYQNPLIIGLLDFVAMAFRFFLIVLLHTFKNLEFLNPFDQCLNLIQLPIDIVCIVFLTRIREFFLFFTTG